VNLADGVAVRVSALCLDQAGRPSDRLIASDAVRAGLLVDLALAGRLTSAEDMIVVDGTPTGFPPADRLLAAMTAEPERSLDGWLGERRVGLRDVVAANVATGRWERRTGLPGVAPRYTDHHRDQTAEDRSRSAFDPPGDGSATDACVTVVAAAGSLLVRGGGVDVVTSPVVLAATGPAQWLCPTVVDHLVRADDRYRAQADALWPGVVWPF
jgi:hypothetical protein